VPSYYLIPTLIIVMCLALAALIFYGAFAEEKRNSRTQA